MLDEKTVKEYLAELGYASVKSFQAAVMYPKYVDGVYGQQTENALISAINVKRNTKNFSVKEFRCECGGKYCCGYPATLKVEMLRNIQAIRDHWGRPVTVTCGLRDKTYNSKLGGSIQNSLHLTGQAVDFYQKGVTDTLVNRKMAIKWIKTLPNHHYTYGNGINSYGNGVSAPYMGNALHIDVSKGSTPAPSPYDKDGKLICDGVGGAATVKEMQRFFGTTKDGIISGQNKTLKKYYPSLTAVKFGTGGSPCIRNLQKWIGVTQDGILGQKTVKAWQKKIGVTADGIFGNGSMKVWQKYLNDHDKAVYPVITKPQKAVEYAEKIANDNSYHYVVWKSNDEKTKQCPICRNFSNGKYKGFNCIRFVFTCWYHAGIPCKHEGALISNGVGDKMYKASDAEMLRLAQNAIGCKDIKVMRNKSGFSDSSLQVGDACMHFENGVYKHIFLYAGNGQMVDAGNWSDVSKQIAVRKRQSCQIMIRYTGK